MKTKTHQVTTPVNPGDDLEALRWYTRESFHTYTSDRNYEIIEYTETEVDPSEVSKEARELYPDAKWIRFTATAKLSDELQAILDAHHGVTRP